MQHNVFWLECALRYICITDLVCMRGFLWCLFAPYLYLSVLVCSWLHKWYISGSWSTCRTCVQGALVKYPTCNVNMQSSSLRSLHVCSVRLGPATGKGFVANNSTIKTYIPRTIMDHGQTSDKPIHGVSVSYVSTAQNRSAFQMPWARHQLWGPSTDYIQLCSLVCHMTATFHT